MRLCTLAFMLLVPVTPASLPLPAAGNTNAARLAYTGGIKRCMDSIPLWVAAARLEERAGNVAKARALLEQVSHGC
jgi:pre-mRNA-processing factor 6